MKKAKKSLKDRVSRPLCAGAAVLCALLTALAAAALYPAARDASHVGLLLLGAFLVFALTAGGSIWLIHTVCRRYLDPVTQAAAVAAQAAAGDHSAPLAGIPRTSDETAALLDAAGDLGQRSTDCLLELEKVLRRIGDGDLTARLSCGRGAECGGACGALEGMEEKLRGAVGSIRSALDQLAGQLDELEGDAQRLAQNGQSRSQDRDALNQAMDRLTKRLQSRAEDAQAVSGDAEKLRQRLTGYDKKIEELTQAVDRIGDCALEADKIVKTMESTAFQCSVLARTAYVEAAGAGVKGKGFAIVASEMRVLAARSAQAAQDAAALMGEMDRTIREGSALAAEASRELRSVAGSGQELCRRAAGAAEEAQETRDTQAAVRQAVRLSAAGAEDQLLAARNAVSVKLLRERAGRLREALRVFRLN